MIVKNVQQLMYIKSYSTVERTWKMEVGGHRKIGRPNTEWIDIIRRYMKEKQVKIEEAQYRRTWRLKT